MIADYYDEVWRTKLSLESYSTLERRWRSRWDFAVERVAPRSRVLDVASGDGVLGQMLQEDKGCRVLGLEISAYAREQAARRGVASLACDISQDPFPAEDGSFDAATLLCCLEHVLDPGHALREAARCVKRGGRLYVTLPNAVTLKHRLSFAAGKLSPDLLHQNDGEGLHLRFFDYARDFDRFVAAQASTLRLVEKLPALKNPRRHGPVGRWLRTRALMAWPNLLAEYSHFAFEVRP